MNILKSQSGCSRGAFERNIWIDIDNEVSQWRAEFTALESVTCFAKHIGLSAARNDSDELAAGRVISPMSFACPAVRSNKDITLNDGFSAAEVLQPSRPEGAVVVAFTKDNVFAHRRSFPMSVREKATSGPGMRHDFRRPSSSCIR